MKRGHGITKATGEMLGADIRKRRFRYERQRAVPARLSENPNPMLHVKTKASCAARNTTTGAMSSVSCDLYVVAANGTVIDSGSDVTVFNPGGTVDANKWATIQLNEAGEYEFVVVQCL